MDILGKLEKLKILAFKDDAFTRPCVTPFFPIFVNPESYTLNYSVMYNTEAANGSVGVSARFTKQDPVEFTFETWFDNTGILDGLPRPDIYVDTEAYRSFLLDLESDTHDMRHFMIIWGKMIFKGRVTALNIEYKLFKPDGTPIRALAKTTLKGSFSDLLRLAKSNLLSADLTHRRVVSAADTLPNLCYEIYGSPKYVTQVAKVNRLTSFRHLQLGQELVFPPFEK